MLDANATTASQIRWQYARSIAAKCPPTLYDEIALTGSSARGIATDQSDIEINFWVATLPSYDARLKWIQSLNTKQVVAHHKPRPDNSYWVNAIYQGIELEAGWQTFAELESALTHLIEACTTDHKALRLAELVLSAKSLRGFGALDKWQAILKNYPSELKPKLVDDALSGWLTAEWQQNRFTAQSYKEDIHRIWRVIFALNHQWEINWKYAHHSLDALTVYPQNIVERIEKIQQSDTQSAAQPMLQLIEDTLQLIKGNFRTTQALSENINQVQLLSNP